MLQIHERYLDIPAAFWEGSESDVLCPQEGTMPWEDFPTIELHLGATQDTSFALVVPPQQYLRAIKNIFEVDSNQDCYKFAISPSETGTWLCSCFLHVRYIRVKH